MNFKVVVYSGDAFQYAKAETALLSIGLDKQSVIRCNSGQESRQDVINNNPNCWLFFLDSDCYLDKDTILLVDKLTSLKSEIALVHCGYYNNPLESSYMQRLHNFMANTWLEESAQDPEKNYLLGGVFLIYTKTPIMINEKNNFWGAEDKKLALDLKQCGYQLNYNKDIRVEHRTSKSILHFLRRSYLHGKNEKFFLEYKKTEINYRFWIDKIGFANLHFLPLVLLHFCIQKMAKLFQKALLLSRR